MCAVRFLHKMEHTCTALPKYNVSNLLYLDTPSSAKSNKKLQEKESQQDNRLSQVLVTAQETDADAHIHIDVYAFADMQ